MKLLRAAIVVLGLSSMLAFAPAAAPTTAPSVDKLLADLASDDFTARELAEDALVQMGASAVDKLNAALAATSDIDVQERLKSALSRIGRVQGLLPTLVTMDRDFQSASEAYELLCKMFDLPLDYDTPALRETAVAIKPFHMTMKDKPWLSAMEQLTVASGVNFRLESGRMMICPSGGNLVDDRPADFRSAIAVLAGTARRRTTIDLTQEQSNSNFLLTLYIPCEPKARLRTERAKMVLSKLEDETGKSLVSDDTTIMLDRPANGRLYARIPLANNITSKKIARIEGEIVGDVVTRMDEFHLDDLTGLPKTLKLGDRGEVSIQSLTKDNGWQLTIEVPTMNGQINGIFQDVTGAANGAEGLRILDQLGRPMTAVPTGQRGNGITQTMTLTLSSPNADAKPTKISWLVVGQTREAKIPFELHDLPLP